MRMVEGFAPGIEREYVPQAFDNRSEKDPVTVWIKSPTEREKRSLFAIGETIKINEDGKHCFETSTTAQHDRFVAAVEKFVTKVANYKNSAGDPIKDGADLATHGEALIVMEVANEIMLSLSLQDEERKKLKGSSTCISVETQVQGGNATNVKNSNCKTQETVKGQKAANHT